MSYVEKSADTELRRTAVCAQGSCCYSWDVELVEDIKRRMILHWNYRNLTKIPQELIAEGEHVKEIYLKRNNIIELSSDIGRLCNLTNLYLGANRLTSLPQTIEGLKSLEVLDVSQNELETLPGTIGNLTKLQNLIVTQNRLKFLPIEMKKLKNLKFLELSDNQLRILNEEITIGLVSLEELGIDRNPIEFLPRNLSHLRKLQSVSACKCDLKYLPSLPFRRLVRGNARSKYSRSRTNDDQDRPNFHFTVDGNVHLNCIPYWLLQLFGPYLSIFGCGKLQEKVNSPFDLPFISFFTNKKSANDNGTMKKTVETFIYFDRIVRHVQTRQNCPSLLELCLRKIYLQSSSSYSGQVNGDCNDLPMNLKTILLGGPLSLCFQCMLPIFTEIWPIIFSTQTEQGDENENENHGREGMSYDGLDYGSILFCSFKCKQSFLTTDDNRSNLYFHDLNFIKRNEISLS